MPSLPRSSQTDRPKSSALSVQAAHLLTQATKSLCRARFSSYEACTREGAVPLNAPLHHLRLSTPGALGYAWQQLIVEKASGTRCMPLGGRARRSSACTVAMPAAGWGPGWMGPGLGKNPCSVAPVCALQVFGIFTARLDADRVASTAAADLDALDTCAQQVAQASRGPSEGCCFISVGSAALRRATSLALPGPIPGRECGSASLSSAAWALLWPSAMQH